jgi:hypothetical protein
LLLHVFYLSDRALSPLLLSGTIDGCKRAPGRFQVMFCLTFLLRAPGITSSGCCDVRLPCG